MAVRDVMEVFGYAGYIGAGILGIGLIDLIIGSPIILQLFSFLDCTYYPNLWVKYHDPYRRRYKVEREYAYSYYKEYLSEAWAAHDFQQVRALKGAKRDWDYIQLYNLMMDWDGNIDDEITL